MNPESQNTNPATEVHRPPRSEDTGAQPRIASSHPDYEILGQIGEGTVATVHEADDLKLNRRVAIKQLRLSLRSDPQQQALFCDEAQFLAGVDHENVVKIFGMDAERGWIVMELMKGSLADALNQGPMDSEAVRSVLCQVLKGLAFLHQQGKLHGEISPGKLLVDGHGRTKIGPSPGALSQGEFRIPSGSRRHVAPEIVNPRQFGDPGPAADLYCLGMTALELLTGPAFERFFVGVSRATVSKELAWVQWHSSPLEVLPPVEQIVPTISPDLASVIDRLIKKPVAQRYGSAEEALADLGEATTNDHRRMGAEDRRKRGLGGASGAQPPLSYRPIGAAASDPSETAGLHSWLACLADMIRQPRNTKNPIVLGGIAVLVVACLVLLTMTRASNRTPHKVEVGISSTPPGARIRIDGRDSGFTNTSVALEPNIDYLVEIDLHGYEKIRQFVHLGSAPEPWKFALKPLTPPVLRKRVLLTTTPTTATILVGGSIVGKGQATPLLTPGEHQIIVRADGYCESTDAIYVGKGPAEFHYNLMPREHRCTFQVIPEDAKVCLDGDEVKGPTFQVNKPQGTYKLTVFRQGYAPLEKEVKVVDRDVLEIVSLVATERRTHVRVVTEPPGATLSYADDGQSRQGLTPLTLDLPEGLHDITLHLPGHRTIQSSILVGKEGGTFWYRFKVVSRDSRFSASPAQADDRRASVGRPEAIQGAVAVDCGKSVF